MLYEINALRCGHIFLHRLWSSMIQMGSLCTGHQLYNELESQRCGERMVFTFRLAVGYFIFLPGSFFHMSPVDLVQDHQL